MTPAWLQAVASSSAWNMRVDSDVDSDDEPITLDDAYQHLRIDAGDDDEWLQPQIAAAREWCEAYLGRPIAQRTVEMAGSAFPSGNIALPLSPVASITGITYTDTAGIPRVLADADWTLDDYATPPTLSPAYGTAWPAARAVANSVIVTYVAGYSAPDDTDQSHALPRSIRSAVLLMLGHLYENRENVVASTSRSAVVTIPMGAESLLDSYRVRLGMA